MSWRETYRQKIPTDAILVDDLNDTEESPSSRENVMRWFGISVFLPSRSAVPDDVQ